MKLVRYKIVETISKSSFFLLMLYFLRIEDAGVFGSFTLIVSLFSIVSGFESHIFLQREIVHKSKKSTLKLIRDAITFFFVNYLFTIPILIIVLGRYDFNNSLLIGCCFIAIGEQLCNAIYNVAIVFEDFIQAMPWIIAKNIILIISTLFALIYGYGNVFNLIFYIWSILSVALIFIFFGFIINGHSKGFFPFKFLIIKAFYRNTYIYFFIGIIAALSIQVDKLMVTVLMSDTNTGIYFRHVALVSILYQFFNIISYNRVLPKIFSAAQYSSRSFLRNILNKEYLLVFGVALFLCVLIFFSSKVDMITGLMSELRIDVLLLSLLILNFTLRAYADFMSLIYNAFRFEIRILIFQCISLFLGLLLMNYFIPLYEIYGVIFSFILGTFSYMALMMIFCPKSKKTDQKEIST